MTTSSVTTELDAVNLMLFSIGESPVNTLTNLEVLDAATALSTLRQQSRVVQSEGWSFNTDPEFTLQASAVAPYEITIPGTALSVDPSGTDKDRDLVMRGVRLYNREDNTYTFEPDEKVVCDIVWLLQFEELPEPVRWYVTVRAARVFQGKADGDQLLHQFTAEDEIQARAVIKRFEARTADANFLKQRMFDTPWSRHRMMRYY